MIKCRTNIFNLQQYEYKLKRRRKITIIKKIKYNQIKHRYCS